MITAQAAEHALLSTTDPLSQGIVAIVVVLVFTLLTMEAAHRVLVVFSAAALIWLLTYLTPFHLLSFDATAGAIDLNVLLLLASMMAIVGVLKQTGFFAWAVAKMMHRARGEPKRAQVIIAWFTATTSALLDNVTTVIFVTPMAADMSRTLRLRPAAILLPMVIASNVGGTATLIGDPPNIMIGSSAQLSFMDFIAALAAPVIVMMVAVQWYSARAFASDFENVAPAAPYAAAPFPVLTDPALFRWMLVICAFVLTGFMTHAITGMPAAIPAAIGAAAALVVQDRLYLRRHRPTAHERAHGVLAVIEREIEWPTLAFFFFLFIIVGAAVATGLIGSVAHALQWTIDSLRERFSLGDQATLFLAAFLICWVSAILSALIDNIPYVAVSIPIVHELTAALPGNTVVLWWALALGACLGGNGTLIGASANVTTVGLAEKSGIRIGFAEFARFGWPVMMITVAIASVFLAVHVFLGEHPARLVSWMIAIPLLVVSIVLTRRTANSK